MFFFCVEMRGLQIGDLFYVSTAFVIVPVMLSLGQLYLAVRKWESNGNDTVKTWIRNHAFCLYALSLVTGSAFSGTQICRSDMFGLSQFGLPLNENQIVGFQTKKLWSTVMLENIPQLVLQIYFLMMHNGSASADMVVYGSMLFSLISIISNTLTFCTQREIAKTTGWVRVQFDVTLPVGSSLNLRRNRYRNRIRKIKEEFAAILEIDKSLIEIARPFPIRRGLRLDMNIYVNHTKAIDMGIESVLEKYANCGELAMVIKDAWNLTVIPHISSFEVHRIASKERRKHAVQLSALEIMKRATSKSKSKSKKLQ